MSEQDARKSWWGMPTDTPWVCAECLEVSPVATWIECEPPCDDCGNHDGRRCPVCESEFDHVWGAEELRKAQPGYQPDDAPQFPSSKAAPGPWNIGLP